MKRHVAGAAAGLLLAFASHAQAPTARNDATSAPLVLKAAHLFAEVHPDPETALSDGYQSLDFDQFAQTMQLCRRVAEALGRVIGSGEKEPRINSDRPAFWTI